MMTGSYYDSVLKNNNYFTTHSVHFIYSYMFKDHFDIEIIHFMD